MSLGEAGQSDLLRCKLKEAFCHAEKFSKAGRMYPNEKYTRSMVMLSHFIRMAGLAL